MRVRLMEEEKTPSDKNTSVKAVENVETKKLIPPFVEKNHKTKIAVVNAR